MKVKEFLQSIIPAYRSRDAILDALQTHMQKTSARLDAIEKRMTETDKKNEYLFYCLQHLDGETELETKKRVFKSLPKADGAVREFQLVANYILQRVKNICDNNGIHFVLSGGTLLGAVRHEGFIPWDDDVDIDIMREDYYRLESIIKEDDKLIMQRYYRYLNNDQKVGYVTKIKLKESDVFYIDIFPRDYLFVPQGREEQIWKETKQLSEEYHDLLEGVFTENGFLNKERVRPEAYTQMDQAVEELEKKYYSLFQEKLCKEGIYNSICLGFDQDYGFRKQHKVVPCEMFMPFDVNSICFEGQRYDSYKNPETWLKIQYGDFWSLPEAIQQQHYREFSDYTEPDRKILKRIIQK